MRQFLFIAISILTIFSVQAQKDTLPKVHHAEPLYMDLIRDLGARKGEQELNIGGSIQKNKTYYSYASFVEYEFALFNRLGMEVEVPISIYQAHAESRKDTTGIFIPKNRIEGLKLSAQYTFFVSPKMKTSMAIGYTNEFIFHSFKTMYSEAKLAKGNLYSPFIVAAKKWGKNVHIMILAGPLYEHVFSSTHNSTGYQIHTSVFKQFWKNNFFGLEFNHVYLNDAYSTILHPQVKMNVSSSFAIGVVTAIPINEHYDPSVFVRIIFQL